MASKRFEKQLSVQNRKAFYDYHISDTWQAGVVLRGTEIKVIRENKINMQDAYCQFVGTELWLLNMHLAPYGEGTHYNHEPRRDRKLLLQRKELKKIEKELTVPGMTLVPTKLYINERGMCKIEIGLARGKKAHDKRDTIKERDIEREQRFEG